MSLRRLTPHPDLATRPVQKLSTWITWSPGVLESFAPGVLESFACARRWGDQGMNTLFGTFVLRPGMRVKLRSQRTQRRQIKISRGLFMASWIFALIVCLVGLVGYALSNNPKAQPLFLHCFWVGLLAFLLTWGGHVALAVH